ncbi:MAG: hypothetical protein HUU34_06565 [Saprospiraceae bacterium]|jgi:FtsH-binding integral membrane protein|nr:hypothetical protein [Saprospiraceae bacterium]
MESRTFIIGLLVTAAIGAGLVLALHMVPLFREHELLSWIGLGFFFFLSILMYLVGSNAARSSNKNQFTTVVMGFTFLKLMLTVLIVLAYDKIALPNGKLFILPFFGEYLIFTIFETYFMMKLGKTSA